MRLPHLFSLLLLTGTLTAPAEVRLPNVFGDHMVLQRDKEVVVWGWAETGEKVIVKFAGQSHATTAGQDGKWRVELDQLAASFEGRELQVSAGEKTVTISDVVVGEVWVCGGQSNMEWTLRGSRDADIEIDSADFPGIRFLRLPKVAHLVPQDDFPVANPKGGEGSWRRAIPEEVESLHRGRLLLCEALASPVAGPRRVAGHLVGRNDGTALGFQGDLTPHRDHGALPRPV